MIYHISSLLDKYLEFIMANKNLSKNTYLGYKNDLSEYIKFTNVKTKSDLIEVDLKSYIKYLAKIFQGKLIVENSHLLKIFTNIFLRKKQLFQIFFQILSFQSPPNQFLRFWKKMRF